MTLPEVLRYDNTAAILRWVAFGNGIFDYVAFAL